MSEKETLMKSLSAAVDVAVAELMALNNLSKAEVNLQEAKIGPAGANGDLAGEGPRCDSCLKPEDAKKAEDKKDEMKEDKKDEKKEDKKDEKKEDEDEDLDDEKAMKMEQKLANFKAKKAAKVDMNKSADMVVAESLKKSLMAPVEEFQKAIGDRIAKLEELIQKIGSAPAPRQSVSGLTPLVKSAEDAQAAESQLSKSNMLNKLFALQMSGDKRVDSNVITRVEIGDLAVLAERDIKLT